MRGSIIAGPGRWDSPNRTFFGGLDTDRIEFTVGRDIQVPGASAPPQNYVIYPHVEVDGAILEEKVKTTFSFAELPGWTPNASAALRS